MLQFSDLTKIVYWTDTKGKKQDVTKEFEQIMLLYMHSDKEEVLQAGEKVQKTIRTKNGKWKITMERL